MNKLVFWILFSGIDLLIRSEAHNWSVLAPLMPPLIMQENGHTAGLLHQLLNETTELSEDGFVVNPSSNWFEKSAINLTTFESGSMECIKNLQKTNSSELCLFQITPSSLMAIHADLSERHNHPDNLVLTHSLLELRPTLLVYCKGKECEPSGLEASKMKALFFMFVFHSSIWSLLLLFILTAGSLLFIFETTKPLELLNHKRVGDNDERFNLLDSYLFVFLAMFLRDYKKFPNSWAGITLVLFWYAFALVCVIAYAAGSVRLLFQPLDQNDSSRQLTISSRTSIVCEQNHFWCDLLKNSTRNVTLQPTVLLRDSTGRIQFDQADFIGNESRAFLTDHLTASQLLNRKDVINATSVTWQRATAGLECNGDSLKSVWNLPPIWVGFVTTNSLAAFAMNRYNLHVFLSGKKASFEQKWFQLPSGSICLDRNFIPEELPVRLAHMNGVLFFMISGALLAVVAHVAEFIYVVFIKEDPRKTVSPENTWEVLT